MLKVNLFLSIILFPLLVLGQHLDPIGAFCRERGHEMFREYFRFLAIPNYARDQENILRNARFIQDMLTRRGIKNRLLSAKSGDTPPAVYGEVLVPGASRTLLFYAHYDGQPVDPVRWHPNLKPFEPIFLSAPIDKGGKILPFPAADQPINPEWRISGRSSSDDKAGVLAIIQAYDALISTGQKPTCSLRFLFEGEEEIGSLHLGEILEGHKDLLAGDLWIVADGPVHSTGLPQVGFGVRGDVNMEVTVFGPKRPLHSGHYGNWAPNPAETLVRLLASMKDQTGRVLVKGYYDGIIPFSASEKRAFGELPEQDARLQRELGIPVPESVGTSLSDSYQYPSLNINGIRSAETGERASNVIPSEATVSLDLRQVPGIDYLRQIQRVKDHIAEQGFYLLDRAPTDEERMAHPRIARVTANKGGYNAQRTPLDLPIAQELMAAVQGASDSRVLAIPTSGGSLPLFLFEKYLGAKVISLGIANHDNNQHAENENARVQNIWDSIRQLAAIMRM